MCSDFNHFTNSKAPHSKLFEKINEKCDYFQNKDLIMNLFHSNESVNFIYTKPQILGDSKDDSSNFVLGPDIPQSAMQLKIDKFVQKDQKIIFTAHLDMRGLKTFVITFLVYSSCVIFFNKRVSVLGVKPAPCGGYIGV